MGLLFLRSRRAGVVLFFFPFFLTFFLRLLWRYPPDLGRNPIELLAPSFLFFFFLNLFIFFLLVLLSPTFLVTLPD